MKQNLRLRELAEFLEKNRSAVLHKLEQGLKGGGEGRLPQKTQNLRETLSELLDNILDTIDHGVGVMLPQRDAHASPELVRQEADILFESEKIIISLATKSLKLNPSEWLTMRYLINRLFHDVMHKKVGGACQCCRIAMETGLAETGRQDALQAEHHGYSRGKSTD